MNDIETIIEELEALEQTICDSINSDNIETTKYSGFKSFADSYFLIMKEIIHTLPDKRGKFTYANIYPKANALNTNVLEQKNAVFAMLTSIRTNKAKLKSLLKKENNDNVTKKQPKLFISHSSKDERIARHFVELLEFLGFNKENMFYSSARTYGVPIDKDIYDEIKEQFNKYNLHVIYMLSENYYNSIPSMQEVGAAWVLMYKYTSILLPGFEFKNIKGAINPNKISIKLDDKNCKFLLTELKDNLIDEFNLKKVDNNLWEQKRDSFIDRVFQELKNCNEESGISNSDIKLNDMAKTILIEGNVSKNGLIEHITDLSGTYVYVNNKEMFRNVVGKEEALLNEAFEQLYSKYYFINIKYNKKGCTEYVITTKGYEYIEKELANK